jgi:4-amino-4-deoxy-L-arabinose transferase-like glycosyltransferase
VDLGLTLFCLLAVLAWEHWQQEGSRRWLVAAGALVGFAAATKHLGLVWLGLLALATWCAAPRRRRAAASGLFLAGAGAVLLPWVVRSVVETANPIFPLLTDWFPSAGSRLERAAGAPLAPGWLGTSHYVAHLVAARRQAWALVSLPWRVAFDRQGFHHQAPLSPYSLLLLPVVAWYAWRERRLRRWLLLIAGYAALGTTTDPRFQLPSVALLALAGGIGVARALARLETTRWARWSRPASVATLALAVVALGPLYAGYKVWRHGPLPATAAAREAFLVRELPGYRAIQSLNARCGAGYTLFAFDGENLTYYTRGRFLGQRSGPFAQRPLVPLLRDPERLHAALLAWGVDDLLVNHPFEPYPPLALAAGTPASPGAAFRGERAGQGLAPPWFQPLPAAPPPELFALLGAAGRPRSPCAAALPLPGGEGRDGSERER